MPSPKGRTALEKKRKERADLKESDIIWIGIKATEANLQRLGAFLLFADYQIESTEPKPVTPLPYEGFEADDPPPPQLEINYELVKKDIVVAMQKMVDRFGEAEAKLVITGELSRFGVDRLREVPEKHLLDLYNTFNRMAEETA